MTTPNWQHHSKKEQKRTLKPQAMRQARKRRQSLKRKLLAACAVLVGVSATPAQALTWEEFWEPFNDDHHHHVHYRGHRHGHRPRRCWGYRTFYYEPDYYGHPGYYKEKLVRVRCRRRYHVHPAF